MPIRLVAIDVDGTLLDPAGTVRPRVERSVKAAVAAGCRVILATGRRRQSAAPLARQLGISTLILMDGAAICDLDSGDALYERILPPPLQHRAIELVRSVGLPPVLFESPAARGRILVGPPDLDNPETAAYLAGRDEVYRLPGDHLVGVARVAGVAGMGDLARIDRLADLARDVADLRSVRWSPSNSGYRTHVVGLNAPDISKGHALGWLAEHLEIPLEQTLAIGDYDNDLSMLIAAGVGIAMGNSVEAVKAVAHAVVADNEHEGVAEALEKWVLNAE